MIIMLMTILSFSIIYQLSVIEKGLEWDKLWTIEGLQYLNVFDNLLQQVNTINEMILIIRLNFEIVIGY